MRVRVGTRGSLLARVQTEAFVRQAAAAWPDAHFETVIVQTTGDVQRAVPFAEVGTKGMFVKELEQALLDHEIDLAIHSLKDMPGELPEGLRLVCTPEREDPLDALLSRSGASLMELSPGDVVGTSSIRRSAQIRHLRPDLHVMELRGNVDTRLRRLDEGAYSAIVLAAAGLMRLGLGSRITERLSPEVFVPAVGQGALAIEARTADVDLADALQYAHHNPTGIAVRAERAFQSVLMAGCTVPTGALATVTARSVKLSAMVCSPDGRELLRTDLEAAQPDAESIGREAARQLLGRGGNAYLKG